MAHVVRQAEWRLLCVFLQVCVEGPKEKLDTTAVSQVNTSLEED